MAKSKLDPKCFLNVDLEVYSKSDLKEFVAALGRKVAVLYIGKEFGANKAYFELPVPPKTPDAGVLGFCKLIEKLPRRERAFWDAAKSRSFDIGIEAPRPGSHCWTAVSPKAVLAAAKVGAQIAVTVYGPMKAAKPVQKQMKVPS
jgi:hypothetical protein